MKKIAAVVCVFVASFAGGDVRATDFTGLYYNTSESGWGANVIHQDTILFVTIFVYGSNGQPTWYVGSSVSFQSGNTFAGDLFTLSGPYFGGPFNPSAVSNRRVGTVTFTAGALGSPSTFTYSVDGTTVTKQVMLQTWKAEPITGSYYGAMVRRADSTCTPTSTPAPSFAAFTVVTGTNNSTLEFTHQVFDGSRNAYEAICTVSSPSASQHGKYIVAGSSAGARYTCLGRTSTAGIYLGYQGGKAAGMEGVLVVFGSSCSDTYNISATKVSGSPSF